MTYTLAHQFASVPRLRALSIRNNKIVVAGEYGDIYVYDFQNDDLTWKLIYSTTLAATVLRSAAIEPNLKAVYIGDSEGTIHKLNLDDYAIKRLPQTHETGKSVSTIATFHPSSFISGAWDGTAIVWQNDQMKLKFANYQTHAVCCCVIHDGLYMTSSQSAQVVLRREIHEPDDVVTQIHGDIVRKIVTFRPYHAVSCSNDGKLGFWSILKPLSGKYVLKPIQVDEYLGYSLETESFIYDVDVATHEDKLYVVYTMEEAHMARLAIFRMEIVDDIVVHLFKEKQVDLCSLSVTTWCIRIQKIVDENQLFKEFAIVAASYNGIIRVFTSNPSLQLSRIEIAEARESLVKEDKTNEDELVIERLPSIQDASDRRYQIKGKVQLFRDITGKNVLVYEWTGSEWNFIGNMVGNPDDRPVSPTTHTQLPENDHASVVDHESVVNRSAFVDVKLSYKPGITYKLKYNRGEDPESIARRFCEHENLELYHMFPIIKQLSEEPNPTSIICELESVSPVKCYSPHGWGKPTVEAAVKKILSTDLQQPIQIKRLSVQQRMVLEGAIGVLDSPNPKIAGPKSKEILATLLQFDWTPWQPANQQFAFYDLLRIALYYDEAADLYRKTSLSKGSLGVFNVLSQLVKSESTAMRSCILKFMTNVCRWASLRSFFVEHVSTIVEYLKSANLKDDTHSSVGPFIFNIALAVQGNMAFAKSATQRTALLLKIRPVSDFRKSIYSL